MRLYLAALLCLFSETCLWVFECSVSVFCSPLHFWNFKINRFVRPHTSQTSRWTTCYSHHRNWLVVISFQDFPVLSFESLFSFWFPGVVQTTHKNVSGRLVNNNIFPDQELLTRQKWNLSLRHTKTECEKKMLCIV